MYAELSRDCLMYTEFSHDSLTCGEFARVCLMVVTVLCAANLLDSATGVRMHRFLPRSPGGVQRERIY